MSLSREKSPGGAAAPRGAPLLLLLNLGILVVTFFVSLGGSETQARLLRTTGRVAFAGALPAAPSAAAPPHGEGRVPEEARPGADGPRRARLLRYLARLPGGRELAPLQVRGLFDALDACCADLAMEEGLLRARSFDLAGASAPLDLLPQRLERTVSAALRAARIPEGEMLDQLVRLVVSSAG